MFVAGRQSKAEANSSNCLFVAERYHRVDFGGAARREVACAHRYQQQEQHRPADADWVYAVDSVQHVCDQATCGEGDGNSNG